MVRTLVGRWMRARLRLRGTLSVEPRGFDGWKWGFSCMMRFTHGVSMGNGTLNHMNGSKGILLVLRYQCECATAIELQVVSICSSALLSSVCSLVFSPL